MINFKKTVNSGIIYALFFSLGFIVHALFFPSLLIDRFSTKITKQEAVSIPIEQNKSLTTVYYRNGVFEPSIVQIRKSYYVRIVNASKNELMWLTSESPLFRTLRGYGESEELKTILYDPNTYTVSSTLHPDKTLRIIVK